jgi:phenylacetic acid degradation operon negative regulatory protein
VTNQDGVHELTSRLLARQAAQDTGRRPADGAWDGTWHTAIAAADQRDLAERRHDRATLQNARFGELRPDIWLRPANLSAPMPGNDWLVTTGPISGVLPGDLVDRLWPLASIAARADALRVEIDDAAATLDRDDPTSIPAAFHLSATVVRFLRDEPLLPLELLPASWPVQTLRDRYDEFERRLQTMLRPFLLDQEPAR